jgi:hypothetical protein
MKYLCLIAATKLMDDMTPSEATSHFVEYQTLLAELRSSGQLVSCSRLEPPREAVTVWVRGGEVHMTDGPYAETKEQLGGFLLIEAGDMREALAIAARIPGAKQGCVEVRPIADDTAKFGQLMPVA